MSRGKLVLACLAAIALGVAAPAQAHHYYAAAFDASNPTTLKGVVTKIAWVNPHAQFFVDVKDKAGRVVNWRCETGSPGDLTRRGLRSTDVKAGDTITIDGYPAKNKSHALAILKITLADGRTVRGSLTGNPESK